MRILVPFGIKVWGLGLRFNPEAEEIQHQAAASSVVTFMNRLKATYLTEAPYHVLCETLDARSLAEPP